MGLIVKRGVLARCSSGADVGWSAMSKRFVTAEALSDEER
jgi:hypothetical protein